MALHNNPRIITDGLVLNLDASAASFPVEVLIVAGGGGGGMDMGGGGGGGGVIHNTNYTVIAGTPITVTVGNGGIGAPAAGTSGQPGAHQYTIGAANGDNSVFGSLTAIGGGWGGSSYWDYLPNYGWGGAGGSGGGASGYHNGYSAQGRYGAGTTGQGNRGGQGGGQYFSGGGGGATQPGGDSQGWASGGDGYACDILGVMYYWGGGGGGSAYSNSRGGNGGRGGGGGGAIGLTVGGDGLNLGSNGGGGNPNSWGNTPGGNAGANTGGGGGGGAHYNNNNKGGDGGSGIVVVKYPGAQKATGGTITTVSGYTIHKFTSSGTFTPVIKDISTVDSGGSFVGSASVGSDSGIPAFLFNGTTDYITAPYSHDTTLDSRTIECVVKVKGATLTSAAAQGVICVMNNDDNPQFMLQVLADGLTIRSSVNYTYNADSAISLNTWYHVVATTNVSDKMNSLYVNGVLIGSASFAAAATWQYSANCVKIGLMKGWANRYLNGNVALARMYNRTLSPAEVTQNYNSVKGRFGI